MLSKQNAFVVSVLILMMNMYLPMDAIANMHTAQSNTLHSSTTQQTVDAASSQGVNFESAPQDPHSTFMASNALGAQNAAATTQDYVGDLQKLSQDNLAYIKKLKADIEKWEGKWITLKDKSVAGFSVKAPMKHLMDALKNEEVQNADCQNLGCVSSDEMDQLDSDIKERLQAIQLGEIFVDNYVLDLQTQLTKAEALQKDIEEEIVNVPQNPHESEKRRLEQVIEGIGEQIAASKASLIKPMKKADKWYKLATVSFTVLKKKVNDFRDKVKDIINNWYAAQQQGTLVWLESFWRVIIWFEEVDRKVL